MTAIIENPNRSKWREQLIVDAPTSTDTSTTQSLMLGGTPYKKNRKIVRDWGSRNRLQDCGSENEREAKLHAWILKNMITDTRPAQGHHQQMC